MHYIWKINIESIVKQQLFLSLNLIGMDKEKNIENRFALHTLTSIVLVMFEEVLFFEYLTEQHCWSLRLTTGEVHKLKMRTTAKMLLTIHPNFVLISQNSIINIKYLRSIENETLKCKFGPPYSDVTLIMSQRCYVNLKNMLNLI